MGYALRLVPNHGFIVAFMWGIARPSEIIDGIRNPGFDPSAAASLDTLVMLDPYTSLSELTPQIGTEIARADRETFFSNPGGTTPTKLAVFCPNAFGLVTMRLIFGMTEQITDYPEERQTFENLDEALSWLGRPDPSLSTQLQAMARDIIK